VNWSPGNLKEVETIHKNGPIIKIVPSRSKV